MTAVRTDRPAVPPEGHRASQKAPGPDMTRAPSETPAQRAGRARENGGLTGTTTRSHSEQCPLWIARDFRGPHLSAVRWLNTHTTDDFAFFAIKLRVVQIGDNSSIVAPLFEVVERPNDWERRLQAVNDIGGNERVINLRNSRGGVLAVLHRTIPQ